MDLCLSSCSLKVAQMSEADATLTEQATGLWGGVALVQLRRFWIGAAHLGTARTCGECRSLSVPCMQCVPMPQFYLFKNMDLCNALPSLDILRITLELGKLHLTPGKFRHVAILKLQIFMPLCATTSAAFKGSNKRSTQKRTAFPLHLQQFYSSYTGQMLKRSQSMSQPCPWLFHSNL